ncbi:MAG: DUF86 domain-containing protein [Spirochaetaceae bacterium]|nr:DUF86 domain-containing protein [Spirochaetaceae bacterium]
MSLKSDTARLEQILEYIEDITKIVFRHENIVRTLEDLEGQYAVMLCLSQIGELLGKIETTDFIEKLPIRVATGLRNIINHDYDGVDLIIVGNTVTHDIPELKNTIVTLLQD